MLVLDEGADGAGHGEADEVLAGAGGGDAAGVVGGVGAGADDGRVADAAKAFAGEAAGGGAGGDVAGSITNDDAGGSPLVGVGSFKLRDGLGGRWGCACGARRDGEVFFFEIAEETLPALFGEEVGVVDLLKAYAGGELVGTCAAEHDELRLVHHGFRQRDGIFCCVTPATAPARMVLPSMMAASR